MQVLEQDIASNLRTYWYLFDLEQVRHELGAHVELVKACAQLALTKLHCEYLARAWLRNETELYDQPRLRTDQLVDACLCFWRRFCALQFQDDHLAQLVERWEEAEGDLEWAIVQLIKRQIEWAERIAPALEHAALG